MRTQEQEKAIAMFGNAVKELQEHDVIFNRGKYTHSIRIFCDNMILTAKEIIREGNEKNVCFLSVQIGHYNFQKIFDDVRFLLSVISQGKLNECNNLPSYFFVYSRLKIEL